MKRLIFYPGQIAVWMLVLIMLSCEDSTVGPPTIVSFSPLAGTAPFDVVPGTPVKITGTNFSEKPSENTVTFNGTAAVVTASSALEITTSVPQGATTGKIAVTTRGMTATSEADFTVAPPPPMISSFTPEGGLPGTTITITGSNFSTVQANNTVSINGVAATVTAASATSITAEVPAGATTGKITVSIPSGVSTHLIASSTNDFEMLIDIPRTGLIAFYPFTGNTEDKSGNAYHLNSTFAQPSIDRFGKPQQAYYFNGTNSSMSAANTDAVPIHNIFTVGLWTKYPGLITSCFVAKKETGADGAKGLILQPNGNQSKFNLLVYGNVNNQFPNNKTNYLPENTTTWFSMIVTYDGNTLKVYKNGEVVETIVASVFIDARAGNGTFRVGNPGVGIGGYFNGDMDDITVYNRALSADEVTQLYQQTVSKY